MLPIPHSIVRRDWYLAFGLEDPLSGEPLDDERSTLTSIIIFCIIIPDVRSKIITLVTMGKKRVLVSYGVDVDAVAGCK